MVRRAGRTAARSRQRGSALLMSIIVVLVISVIGVSVIRFASREVSGAASGRKAAALAACAEAGRALLMSRWKLLGPHGLNAPVLNDLLDPASGASVLGGHYGDDAPTQAVQVIRVDPVSVGPMNEVNELTNRIGEQVQPLRVVVHCVQGQERRQLEVEFGLRYGL